MDIKPPISANLPLPLLSAGVTNGLELKLNQLIPAKIIETQILLNTLSVALGEKTVSLQAEQPLKMSPGQTIELQVSKLLPTPEFKLVTPPPPSGQPQPRLTLIAKADSTAASINKAIITNAAPLETTEQSTAGQRFTATVISVSPNKLTLMPMPAMQQTSQPGIVKSAAPTLAPTTTPPGLAADQTLTPKPLILDIKQLFIATSDLPASQPSTSVVRQSFPQNTAPIIPQNVNPGVSTDKQTVYVPIKNVANLLLKPELAIELQVLKKGPLPTFIISFPKETTTPTLAELQKQLLPIQIPLQPFLQHLQQLAEPAPRETGTVGEILQHLAKAILRDLPSKSALMEPAQLKQQVANSGLFMESKLLQLLTQPALPPEQLLLQEDLKFKLSKLADTIKQLLDTPKPSSDKTQILELEVLKQSLTKTEGALAKQTLEQLSSLPRDDGSKQQWIIELPFFNPPGTDSVSLQIEQDQAGSPDSKQKNWSVSITISPPDLGTIHCKLSCYDGSINSRFWSESVDTVDKINGHLDYLKQQFELKGLVAGFMEAHQGKPIVADNPKQPPASLLSVKA